MSALLETPFGARGIPRIEARAKVTGAACYAADHDVARMLHAVIVGAPVAAGRIDAIDTAAALKVPGVVAVLTHEDMPRFRKVDAPSAVVKLPMQDTEIRHEGQIVALVLGETIEAAEEARPLVAVRCTASAPLLLGAGSIEAPPEAGMGDDLVLGDVAAGLANADVRIEQTYLQAPRHHHAMETSGTLAIWEGEKLTLWDAVQASSTVIPIVAGALGIDPKNVRVRAPHTGGGFGSKGYVWPHQILAAAAAKVAGRPVKLQLRRSDQFSTVGYQPDMAMAVGLGAKRNGTLTALRFEVRNNSAIADTHVEPASEAAKTMYAIPAIATKQRIERVNLNVPTPMRAPVEGPGMWALESAMNEMADALGIDPLELRLRNHADVDPHDGRPWSSKRLREAYAWAADRYGWSDRHSRPRTDGDWAIGHGMATCSMGSFRFPGSARVRITADGVFVEANVHDIGTGAQTILAQVASDELGIPVDCISVQWGDTDLPAATPTYGSSTTVGTGSAVAFACRELRERLSAPEGGDVLAAFASSGERELATTGNFTLPEDKPFSSDGAGTPWAMRTWGAIFVEVGVDRELGLVRLRRAVGAYSAGRILNPRTARSQMTGGIIWGWGKATMEVTIQEPVHGRWLAKNLSNVALPVNADIPADVDVHFIDEYDEHASAIGARGIGELAATGVDAAVAAAIFDAVGVRMRDLPILPAKIIDALSR
jgi:xanthine dehydrogenase YagR molybdenum-binding subunit